jgi:hypothetical protein
VFLDAVEHGRVFAQTDWPDGTYFLLNIYQQNPENRVFGGGPIDPNTVPDGSILDDINTTTDPNFPHNLTHFSIDDDPQIQAGIQGQLGGLMDR